ncbi:chemotaxis protein CheW [Gloeothece citriformis]|uniref:chemotaxis protein CheW n=1 Tax=Gloeothece citriformis TaxID=2546356 RepID=UPI003B83561C
MKEITSVVWVHTLPHRSNHILRGIVNIRGEILTCVSLSNLLNLKPTKNLSKTAQPSINYPRMIVLEIQENRWVFEADELDKVHRFYSNQFQDSPTALSKHHDTYTQKIINFNHKKVNYLDSELLFYELLFYTYSRSQSSSNNIETINP